MDETTKPGVKLTFSLQTNKVGSLCTATIEVDDDEWAELDEGEREAYAKEMFWDTVLDRLGSWDWEEA